MSTDIMIDLETLGTTADCVILSIGAVAFDLDAYSVGGYTYYAVTSLESQPARSINRDTLAWWTTQSPEAAAVLTHQPKQTIASALDGLRVFVKEAIETSGTLQVWSNGADFDLPILNHAYAECNIRAPWAPYSARCYRTYKNLPGARQVKAQRTGNHHNALDDAIYQAHHLCAIHEALFMVPVQGGAA